MYENGGCPCMTLGVSFYEDPEFSDPDLLGGCHVCLVVLAHDCPSHSGNPRNDKFRGL